MTLDRRQFILGASALGATFGAGCSGSQPTASPRPTGTVALRSASAGSAGQSRSTDGTLVVVTLVGGNDALNTVCPVLDGTYRSKRGDLALDPTATHDIGEGFALHPSLTRAKALWDGGRLGVVHGVGFGSLDRSHFHCMDVWQAGDEHDLTTGWLGRWLDTTDGDPLRGVGIGRRLPLLLRGASTTGAVVPPGPFTLPGDQRTRSLLGQLAATDDSLGPLAAVVGQANADLLSVVDRVAPATADLGASTTLDARFRTVAAMIAAGLPTRVYAIEHGGFDTHAAQPAQHDVLLGELDAALGAFLDQVGERNVTVLVSSEFGRRVAPNASLGTDHGAAGTVLVAGSVRGGHHGEPPPLDRLTDGDLTTTVDFRAVYGGLLEGVLGIDAGDVLAKAPTPLALV